MQKRGDRSRRIIIFLACVIAVFLIAVIGGSFVFSNIGNGWYDSVRPDISPPNWVFGVVWNILFLLIAFSLYFALIDSKNAVQKYQIVIAFSVNLILNALWTYVFFASKQVLWALYEAVLIWLSIIIVMAVVWNISRRSFWLLIPYLLWISFAIVLNYLAYLRYLLS